MYVIRQYDSLSNEDKFKVIKQTADRYAAKVEMLKLADKEENGNWILWKKSGKDMIRLQTLSN